MKVDGKRDGREEGRKTVSGRQYQGHNDTNDRKGVFYQIKQNKNKKNAGPNSLHHIKERLGWRSCRYDFCFNSIPNSAGALKQPG